MKFIKKIINGGAHAGKTVPLPILIKENKLLNGKNAVITGGNSGIGYAIAKKFSENGANTVIVGRDKASLKEKSNSLNNCKFFQLDLLNIHYIKEAVSKIADMCNEQTIDILVNCAGITEKNSFFNIDPDEFERILRINIEGTFFMSREVGNIMIKHNTQGHILNISSSSSVRPATGPYKISKWAVKGMTLGLAEIFTPYGITVNSIAPGKTATPMLNKSEDSDLTCIEQPCGRYITPAEIAQLATFMVSEMGNMIIGDTVFISGGNGTIMI